MSKEPTREEIFQCVAAALTGLCAHHGTKNRKLLLTDTEVAGLTASAVILGMEVAEDIVRQCES